MIQLLYGDNDLEIDEAIRDARRRYGETEVTTFDGTDVSLSDLGTACLTAGLFDPERLVIVDGLHQRFKGARKGSAELEELATILAALPRTTTLLIVGRDMPADSSLVGAVRGAGGKVRSFSSPRRGELPRWIVDRGPKLDVTVEPAAAEVLADLVGANPLLLQSELEKLATYAGDEKRVTPEMVEQLAGAVSQDSIFTLVDAIGDGEEARALRLLHAQLESASTDNIDFALYLIRMLARQVRILLRIQIGQGQGRKVPQIVADLKLPRYYADRYFRQARRLSMSRLTAAFEQLAAFELQLKRGEIDAPLGLDLLVTGMCR